MHKLCFVLFFVLCAVLLSCAAIVGENCTGNGKDGKCQKFVDCPTAADELRKGVRPKVCGFENSEPVVCCVGNANTAQATTTTTTKTTTTEDLPTYVDYEEVEIDCPPISTTLTKPKTGRKAWDKCIEYQEQLVYPCVKGMTLTGGKTRVNYCLHSADELIIGGENAGYGEFPHMVLLGYGSNIEQASWDCGGTLISDRFILTAGHCASTRLGDVSFARLSLLKRTDPINTVTKRAYNIERIFKHPNYNPPQKYNDIALLQTSTTMLLDRFAVPACVHFGNTVKDHKAIATGWGSIKHRGNISNVLQKVTLSKYEDSECGDNYQDNRFLKQGILDTQICYGDRDVSKDTCQGDSGGPLHIKNMDIHCMYTVIGVTSFGSGCGQINVPGVYTRVASYAEWIEKTVWG